MRFRITAGTNMPRRSRLAITLATFTAAITSGSATAMANAPRAQSPLSAGGSSVVHRYSPTYMGANLRFSQTEAVAVAREFDVIAATSQAFSPYLGAMRAAKPTLKVTVYLNGTFDLSSGGTTYPASWYEHDARGNRVRSTFGNYLLIPSNPAWQAAVATQCATERSRSGYDGCFIDTLGTAPITPGYVTGLPINPATHNVWLAADWIRATSSIAATVQAKNRGAPVIANGIADGMKYFDSGGASTKPLVATTGTAEVELFLRSDATGVTNYRSQSDWKKDVDMLVDAETHGWSLLTVTKLWVPATSAQQDQWHKYTLASFLLGAGGHCAYSFLASSASAATVADTPWDHPATGTPTGHYLQQGSLFVRTFSSGFVAVNPTGSPATLRLPGTYTNLAGARVSSETLQANSADVFVH